MEQGGGADTAILVKASSTKDMLGSDIERRLEIKEMVGITPKTPYPPKEGRYKLNVKDIHANSC
jgi:hypothetical protein